MSDNAFGITITLILVGAALIMVLLTRDCAIQVWGQRPTVAEVGK